MGWLVAGSLGLFACNVENYEDCPQDDDVSDDFGGSHSRAGSTSRAGTSSTSDGGGGSGASSPCVGGTVDDGSSEGGGGAAPPAPQPVSCDDEQDCPKGFNCNVDAQQCQAADEETCGELTSEAACTHRSDCTPVYAGTNCSCGKDCECHGGEPGCVCEAFQFFVCQAAE
jgi:hypothetical protein